MPLQYGFYRTRIAVGDLLGKVVALTKDLTCDVHDFFCVGIIFGSHLALLKEALEAPKGIKISGSIVMIQPWRKGQKTPPTRP